MSPDEVHERYARIRAAIGPDVTIVAATKYVSLRDMATLAEAGVEVVGENRAQDLRAKHDAYGDAFRWHFIGHLPSRKAPLVGRPRRPGLRREARRVRRRLPLALHRPPPEPQGAARERALRALPFARLGVRRP